MTPASDKFTAAETLAFVIGFGTPALLAISGTIPGWAGSLIAVAVLAGFIWREVLTERRRRGQ